MMEQKNHPTTVSPAKKTKIPLMLANIAIIISLLSFISQLFFWQLHKRNERRIIAAAQEGLRPYVGQMQADLNQHQQLLNAIRSQLDQEGNKGTTQVLAETEYLVAIAYYNLIYSYNVDAAVKILQGADQKLAKVNDVTLTPIRQSLANDIVALQSAPKVDVPGLLMKLSAISDQVQKLSLLAPLAQPKTIQKSAPLQTWKEKIWSSLAELKGIVVVRRLDEPVKPLLMPEQQFYLEENIRLQLNKAEWAVLNKEQQVYIASLQKARALIQQYYVRNPETPGLIKMLEELQVVNIKPPLPDLTKTLSLFQKTNQTSNVSQP